MMMQTFYSVNNKKKQHIICMKVAKISNIFHCHRVLPFAISVPCVGY